MTSERGLVESWETYHQNKEVGDQDEGLILNFFLNQEEAVPALFLL